MKKGFTLVELLVVIAIISILVTLVIIAIDPLTVIRKSRDSKDRSELNGVKAALQLFFNERNDYPASGVANLETALETDYMRDVPAAVNSYTRLSATNYEASIPINHVIPADQEAATKCGKAADGLGGAGTFWVCPD
jgi:prepilin-type N-terminal cleavage/methylation domain-containing protein